LRALARAVQAFKGNELAAMGLGHGKDDKALRGRCQGSGLRCQGKMVWWRPC
jgi:hypothetical protein